MHKPQGCWVQQARIQDPAVTHIHHVTSTPASGEGLGLGLCTSLRASEPAGLSGSCSHMQHSS